ncbi:unnamed protein product [Chondrus crispus]|uniref:Peptidase S59 domain-containing protein n=1 Tax=Chondrus crispus TaxID=2769 RepID=R7QAH0_CHOCR|nr:unnamed protein product [Chondrus crispus]CDF35044.1 unnamed protein product [Chondrus crispus]|eukprot:XP_005714863.1 unnamed protein product [Chondrus crispus]
MPAEGSRAAKWQLSQLSDSASGSSSEAGKYLTISAMHPFRSFSVEEIRLHDYSRGDKGADQPQPVFGAFGSQQQQPFAATGFGASAAPAFGASSASGFGSTIFGASQSAFGGGAAATPAPSLFGSSAASSQPSLFGAPAQPNTGASLFGAPGQPNPTPSLFGAPAQPNPAAPSLFGAGQQQQPNTAASLFGAPAQSAPVRLFGAQPASSAFGAAPSFGAAAPKQSAPSLFGASTGFGGFGAASQPASGASLFGGGSSGASLFGNTGGSLFGSTPATSAFGATSGSLFGGNTAGSLFGQGGQSGFGKPSAGAFGMAGAFGGQSLQQQQQAHGPLEASLTANPFGESNLFSGVAAAARSMPGGAGASVINTAVAIGQTQPKAVSVVVKTPTEPYRRTRASEVLAKHNVLRRRDPGSGWFAASPMRPWRESGSVFNVGTVLRPKTNRRGGFGRPQAVRYDVTPWRTEEQRLKAANIKRLVVEPMTNDPILNRNRQFQDGQDSEQSGAGERGALGDDMETSDGRPSDINGRNEDPFGSFEPGTESATQEAVAEGIGEVIGDGDDDADQGLPRSTQYHDAHASGLAHDDDGSSPNVRQESDERSTGPAVEYTEVAQKELSASKTRLSLGANRNRRSWRRGSVHMPTCNDPEYYMIPTHDELAKMSSDELSKVDELTIGKKGLGEISWLEPVDMRGLDIDQVVQIKKREVSVYPRDDDVPAVGTGLNKPARVKLFGIHKLDKRTNEPLTDATTAAKMVGKLKAHCQKEGLKFLGYDVKTGTWTFQSNSF